MARKSRKVDYVNVGNKENLVTEAENQCEKVSHAALYARLSYESEKNRERNTIETQMVLLHNFVKEQKDIVVAKEYYDISKTGTNFERDGFNEMMQDIKEGNIDCVIVKDLSRLGRNYVEAGSYIERVFPFFNVRFISVNDHYDSFRDRLVLETTMEMILCMFESCDTEEFTEILGKLLGGKQTSKVAAHLEALEELLTEEEYSSFLAEYLGYLTVNVAEFIRSTIIENGLMLLAGSGGEEDGEEDGEDGL